MMAKRSAYLASLGAALIAAGTAALVISQSQSSGSSGRGVWIAVGTGLLVLGAAAVLGSAVSAALDAGERRSSPFCIEHDEQDAQCRQVNDGKGIQLRVKVRNSGNTGLIHVRARASLKDGHEHWLRIRHDNGRPNYERSQIGEILPPRDDFWVYFDVAWLAANNPAEKVMIEFADEFLRSDSGSSAKQRAIKITAWGTREDDDTTVKETSVTYELVRDDETVKLMPLTSANG